MNEKMPNWLYKRAELTPERIALRTDNEELTFAQLNERSKRTAQRLAQLGVKKDDNVAVLMDNNLHTVEIIHALEYIGAVVVLLNTRLTAHELIWQVKDSEAKYLIYDKKYEEHVCHITLTNPAVYTAVVDELFKLKGINTSLEYEFDLNKPHSIIYTSGTTGNPKGVLLTYGNHWWSAVSSSLNIGLHYNDCWLLCLPIFHVSGLSIVIRSIIYGISINLHESFVPFKVNEAIINKKITIISVVSVMLSQMLEVLNTTYPDTMRCVLLGGGFVPESLLEKSKNLNIPVFQTYGMTETASQIATLGPEYLISKSGSAGKPLFSTQLKIINDGRIQKPFEAGEIVVKGPNVTKGYYKNIKATKKTIKNGWLYTGDMGYLDGEGFLYVLDRRSDLIVSGGENIYPAEIESVILKYPAVEDAAAVGRTHEKWGEVPAAFVKLKSNKNVTAEELMEFCRERLAKYKVPKIFEFVNKLPRNASNKIMRRKLKDRD